MERNPGQRQGVDGVEQDLIRVQAMRPMGSASDNSSSLIMLDASRHLMVVLDIIVIFLGWLAASAEVFLRRDFGERYLSPIRLLIGASAFTATFLLSGLASIFAGQSTPGGLLAVFFLAYIGLGIFHLFWIAWRNGNGVRWHSLCFGISWFDPIYQRLGRWWRERQEEWPLARLYIVDDWTFYCWVEPIWCLWLGFLFSRVDSAVGIWLSGAGVAMLLRNNLYYYRQRNRLLDIIDAGIEVDLFTEATQEFDRRKTAGFNLVSIPVTFKSRRPTFNPMSPSGTEVATSVPGGPGPEVTSSTLDSDRPSPPPT